MASRGGFAATHQLGNFGHLAVAEVAKRQGGSLLRADCFECSDKAWIERLDVYGGDELIRNVAR